MMECELSFVRRQCATPSGNLLKGEKGSELLIDSWAAKLQELEVRSSVVSGEQRPVRGLPDRFAFSEPVRLNHNDPPINSVLSFGFAFKAHPCSRMDFVGIDGLTGVGIDETHLSREQVFYGARFRSRLNFDGMFLEFEPGDRLDHGHRCGRGR